MACKYFSFSSSSSKLFGVSHLCHKLLLVPISHIIWPVRHIILKLRISIAYNHVIIGLLFPLFPPAFISINVLTASGSYLVLPTVETTPNVTFYVSYLLSSLTRPLKYYSHIRYIFPSTAQHPTVQHSQYLLKGRIGKIKEKGLRS